jgi:hypothetical protein
MLTGNLDLLFLASDRFAAKDFTFQIQNSERKRDGYSIQEKFQCNYSINREIEVYHYGNSKKKMILIHTSWSGTGIAVLKSL